MLVDTKPPDRAMTWPIIEGSSLLHWHIHRGKRSITLDLRSDEGKEVFLDLVKDAGRLEAAYNDSAGVTVTAIPVHHGSWAHAFAFRVDTPDRAILITGILAITFLFIDSLEALAEIASVLQLFSYAALCVGVIVLLVANPAWYKRTFRAPMTPYLQIIATL